MMGEGSQPHDKKTAWCGWMKHLRGAYFSSLPARGRLGNGLACASRHPYFIAFYLSVLLVLLPYYLVDRQTDIGSVYSYYTYFIHSFDLPFVFSYYCDDTILSGKTLLNIKK
ncbi:hypothetical protein V8F33_003987 [Rhypophila sp. PSN 637]